MRAPWPDEARRSALVIRGTSVRPRDVQATLAPSVDEFDAVGCRRSSQSGGAICRVDGRTRSPDGDLVGFLLAYQVARGLADRHPERAFSNGLRVVNFETHFTTGSTS